MMPKDPAGAFWIRPIKDASQNIHLARRASQFKQVPPLPILAYIYHRPDDSSCNFVTIQL